MYGRKDDFEGYLNEAEVRENSSSSNVAQNKDGISNKEEETQKLSSAVKGSEVEKQAHKSCKYNLVCGTMLRTASYKKLYINKNRLCTIT